MRALQGIIEGDLLLIKVGPSSSIPGRSWEGGDVNSTNMKMGRIVDRAHRPTQHIPKKYQVFLLNDCLLKQATVSTFKESLSKKHVLTTAFLSPCWKGSTHFVGCSTFPETCIWGYDPRTILLRHSITTRRLTKHLNIPYTTVQIKLKPKHLHFVLIFVAGVAFMRLFKHDNLFQPMADFICLFNCFAPVDWESLQWAPTCIPCELRPLQSWLNRCNGKKDKNQSHLDNMPRKINPKTFP